MVDDIKRRQLFYEKIMPEPMSGCWIWTGSIGTHGYGWFKFRGKAETSHRVSYILHKGEIAKNLMVRHTCDNRWCVNPDHLLSGTSKDNVEDMYRRGGGKKFVKEDVIEIKRMANSGIKVSIIASKMGVNRSCIYKILSGESWSRYAEETFHQSLKGKPVNA